MMWLTWRQFRIQAIAAGTVLVALAAVLIATRPHLTSLANSTGLASCHVNCAAQAIKFLNEAGASQFDTALYYAGLVVVFAAPLLIGLFWGAPLLTREIEAGTFRLAWNQSVTRTRWLAVKLGIIALAAMLSAGLLSLLVTWWAGPLDRAGQLSNGYGAALARLEPLVFGARGIVPIGYAAFAVTLGVTAGVIIRRTVPAMATTLASFAFVQIAWPNWIRPHLITPVTAHPAFNPAGSFGMNMTSGGQLTIFGAWSQPGAWVLSDQTMTPAGHPFVGPATAACTSGTQQQCNAWLAGQHLQQLVSYQPASRFWALQWYETGLFLVLAVALAAFCVWWITRHRIA